MNGEKRAGNRMTRDGLVFRWMGSGTRMAHSIQFTAERYRARGAVPTGRKITVHYP